MIQRRSDRMYECDDDAIRKAVRNSFTQHPYESTPCSPHERDDTQHSFARNLLACLLVRSHSLPGERRDPRIRPVSASMQAFRLNADTCNTSCFPSPLIATNTRQCCAYCAASHTRYARRGRCRLACAMRSMFGYGGASERLPVAIYD